jgi:ribonuclease P protein component
VQQFRGPALNAVEHTPDVRSHRFPKNRRVRRRREFQQAFQRGFRLNSRYFTTVVLPNGSSVCRLGIVASRKFGDAVNRNRAKRVIREIFRQLDVTGGPAADLIVIPRRELLTADYPAAEDDFRTIWRRAAQRTAASASR